MNQVDIDSLTAAIEECFELEVVARNLHTSSAQAAELLAAALVQRGVKAPLKERTPPPPVKAPANWAYSLARRELERRIGTYGAHVKIPLYEAAVPEAGRPAAV